MPFKKAEYDVRPPIPMVTQIGAPTNNIQMTSQDVENPSSKEQEQGILERNKFLRVSVGILKFIAVALLLYLFICSLSFLADSFRLIAGRATGSVFKNKFIDNPMVGLMIGILVTVLVQSSSTSTSIIVSLVNSGLLKVHAAVPMIMGSNVGTSVTNTIVSLTQVGDKEEFRRAFAGATVHDMFNWLTVSTLLLVEVCTGMLQTLTQAIIEKIDWDQGGKGHNIKILKVITEPFTKRIIKLDKKVLIGWSLNDTSYDNATLIPKYCKYMEVPVLPADVAGNYNFTDGEVEKVGIPNSCNFLFANTSMTDTQTGLILLFIALTILCGALILIVKILNSMLRGSIAKVIKVTLNADIPYVPWLTGYIAIAIGAVMTLIVQSSSIFTSTLTPLIGLGLISVERSYPLTLGSNIGTTTTALLASLSGEGDGLKNSVQIALVHLFFNIFGILLFYPIPQMRFPIPMCKALGDITARYRWFAVLYMILMFLVLPGFVFLLSYGGIVPLYLIGIPTLLLILFIISVNLLKKYKPSSLPPILRSWLFLPEPLRSLDPWDRIITSLPCCKSCRYQFDADEPEKVVHTTNHTSVGVDNIGYQR